MLKFEGRQQYIIPCLLKIFFRKKKFSDLLKCLMTLENGSYFPKSTNKKLIFIQPFLDNKLHYIHFQNNLFTILNCKIIHGTTHAENSDSPASRISIFIWHISCHKTTIKWIWKSYDRKEIYIDTFCYQSFLFLWQQLVSELIPQRYQVLIRKISVFYC